MAEKQLASIIVTAVKNEEAPTVTANAISDIHDNDIQHNQQHPRHLNLNGSIHKIEHAINIRNTSKTVVDKKATSTIDTNNASNTTSTTTTNIDTNTTNYDANQSNNESTNDSVTDESTNDDANEIDDANKVNNKSDANQSNNESTNYDANQSNNESTND
eukprot:CAMPEP_0172299272 /NCGR_PEP_ID=MMETSP1058-20130122/1632_1 /TAXON_ID=83371 /ORGANISM="Detonula confervacea, Strain CCMP 353" /LENGTH=159 /DNA_ID=CAMNT_0013008679 /DNA_START=257 /DNA_END=734 /DNA_ORIENTATION=+